MDFSTGPKTSMPFDLEAIEKALNADNALR